jgi:hypothetical protein
MTLTKCITDAVSNALDEFVQRVVDSGGCSLDREQLLALWNGEDKTDSGKADSGRVTPDELVRATKAELVALCKKNSLKCTGKKEELISRLVGNGSRDGPKEIPKKDSNPVDGEAPKRTRKDVAKFLKQRLSSKQKEICLITNKFGNDVHEETQLVFNRTSQATGKQLADGSVSDLTMDDINLCNKYGFDYIIPENLNTADTADTATREDSDIDMYSDGEDEGDVPDDLEELLDEEDDDAEEF